MIVALRLICLALWLSVAASTASSAWRSLRGRTSFNDAWRGVIFFISMMIVGFLVRWYVAESSLPAHVSLYILSAGCAAYAIRVVRAYGRGH